MDNGKRTGNKLLDLLPREELESVLASARTASLTHGEEVYRQYGPMTHVYFPISGVLGLVVLTEEGHHVEGTTIGREGMLGLPAFLGLDFHPFPAVSEVAGEVLLVPTSAFMRAARAGGSLDRLLRRYAVYRIGCANQTSACNTLHTVEERISRWLLMTRDRAGQDELRLTHEYLSNLLGVRRQTVSVAARTLQDAGLIAYQRGSLRVLDGEGLEAVSCECYSVLTRLYQRIMSDGPTNGSAE